MIRNFYRAPLNPDYYAGEDTRDRIRKIFPSHYESGFLDQIIDQAPTEWEHLPAAFKHGHSEWEIFSPAILEGVARGLIEVEWQERGSTRYVHENNTTYWRKKPADLFNRTEP